MKIIFPFFFSAALILIMKIILWFLHNKVFIVISISVFFSNTNICYMAQLYIIIYLNFIKKKVNLNSGQCFIPLELRGGRALHNNIFFRSHVHNVYDLKVQ